MHQTPIDHVCITLIGGPTALIEIGPLRLLTDPTFDAAGSGYIAGTKELRKISDPALIPSVLGPVNVVLLSHDHHSDNLDRAGRTYLSQATCVLTTPAGAQRLGNHARGVATWETIVVTGADGQNVRVTATPARHGPAEIQKV